MSGAAPGGVFGRILTEQQVEQAVLDTLQHWMNRYLREVERQAGRDAGSLPAIRGWIRLNEFDQQQGDQLPMVLVICPGLAARPVKRGKTYEAWWSVSVGIIASGRDQGASRDLAASYAAAARTILVHKARLQGHGEEPFADSIDLLDESTTDAPANYLPAGAVARVSVNVLTRGLVEATGGPITPDDDETDWPRFTSYDIDIEEVEEITHA